MVLWNLSYILQDVNLMPTNRQSTTSTSEYRIVIERQHTLKIFEFRSVELMKIEDCIIIRETIYNITMQLSVKRHLIQSCVSETRGLSSLAIEKTLDRQMKKIPPDRVHCYMYGE